MNLQKINKAILSEKAYIAMEQGTYTFVVEKAATKKDVKKAVEREFSTKVARIRLLAIPTKTKRIAKTRRTTTIGGGKKAIVTLVKGEKIAMLSPKAEPKAKAERVSKVAKDKETKEENKKGLFSKIRKSKETKEDK